MSRYFRIAFYAVGSGCWLYVALVEFGVKLPQLSVMETFILVGVCLLSAIAGMRQ